MSRRDVVILDDATAGKLSQGVAHRRGNRDVQDRDISASCVWIRKETDVVLEVLVDREGVDLRCMPPRSQKVTDSPRAVADGIAAMCRGHPFVDDHTPTESGDSWLLTPLFRQCFKGRRTILPNVFERF